MQQNGLPGHSHPMDQHNLPSRSERIHQLRAQHQRKHVERRGQYPLDEREERYEQAIRQVTFVSTHFTYIKYYNNHYTLDLSNYITN
jgi:hypothetical protein